MNSQQHTTTDVTFDLLQRKLTEVSNLCNTVGTLLSAVKDVDRILTVLLEIALNVVDAEVGSIMLLEKGTLKTRVTWGMETDTLHKIRLPEENHPPLLDEILAKNTGLHSSEVTDISALSGISNVSVKSVLSVPLTSITSGKLHGILTVVNKRNHQCFDDWDSDIITTIAKFSSVAIANVHLYSESIKANRLKQELKLAQNIQMELLPLLPPTLENASLSAKCIPAREVGGDYFDFLKLKDGKIAIVVGDVSGHGIASSLIMTTARGVLRAEATRDATPSQIMARINQILYEDLYRNNGMFLTIVLGIYDPKNKSLTYVNAGHNYPIILKHSTQEIVPLKEGGIFIGFGAQTEYEQETITLDAGDVAVFYTDGATERFNPQFDMFTKERLYDIVKKYGNLTSVAIREKLFEEIERFSQGQRPNDDTTIVVLKVER